MTVQFLISKAKTSPGILTFSQRLLKFLGLKLFESTVWLDYLEYSSIGVWSCEGDLSCPSLRKMLLVPGNGAGGPASIKDLKVEDLLWWFKFKN